MALKENEIVEGAIAYFDVDVLHQDKDVVITGDKIIRDSKNGNQFVCHKIDGDICYWSPLTASYKFPRLAISAGWVTNGYGPLGVGKVWLQDGKNTYRGPKPSFVAAAIGEHAFDNGRPSLSHEALEKIYEQIDKRGGAR